MNNPNALFTAILTAWNAAGALSGITGGLWLLAAPAAYQVARPWCVLFNPQGDKTDWAFGAKAIEPYALQFSVFAASAAQVMGFAGNIESVFDTFTTALTDGTTLLRMLRLYPPANRMDPTLRDENGQNVWRADLVYRAIVQEN